MSPLGAILVFAAVLGATDAQQRLASGVEAVRLDVSVQLNDPSVSRLSAADFAVLDEGQPRQVSLVSTDTIPIDVVLLLDTSRSTAGTQQEELLAASEALLASLRPQDRIALVTFADLVEGRVAFTSDVIRVREALKKIDSVGRTSLFDAVVAGLSVATSTSRRTLMIVCSDGVENTSFLPREALEAVVRGSEAVLYTVITGTGDALENIAELSGGSSLRASSEESLSAAFTKVLEQFRRRYLLSFYVDVNAAPGWHRVQVRLTKHSGRVRHRQGYWRSLHYSPREDPTL